MTHLSEKIAEFVFEELSAPEMANAKRHLADCSDCRQQVEEFQHTHAMLRTSQDADLPRRMIFEVEKPAAASWIWQWLSPAGAAIAASVITALMLRPEAPPAVQPAERVIVQQQAAPAVSPSVDYEKINNELRAFLTAELAKRDSAQSKEIQLVRTQLAYLDSLQSAMRRDTADITRSIQQLADRSDSQE